MCDRSRRDLCEVPSLRKKRSTFRLLILFRQELQLLPKALRTDSVSRPRPRDAGAEWPSSHHRVKGRGIQVRVTIILCIDIKHELAQQASRYGYIG